MRHEAAYVWCLLLQGHVQPARYNSSFNLKEVQRVLKNA